MTKGPSGPGRGAQEAAAIDHGDPARLGIDHQPFGHAIARKGYDITRIERKHLTLRTRMMRLARKTICFSKSVLMHDTVIGLFINRHEFGRAV